MKRAAGVDTIEEVVDRFQTQEFTGKVGLQISILQ
jgi:hypothetical protein